SSAATRSPRSTMAPRPTLMRYAVGFICRNCARRNIRSVAGVCGAAMTTKSLSASNSGNRSTGRSQATPAGASALTGSTATTRRPPPRHLAADAAQPDDAERHVRQVQVRPVDAGDVGRPHDEVDALALAPDRRPVAPGLLQDVPVQVAGEADDVAEDLVGDDVG